ncbi:MAG: hypothetical protein KGL39_06335 [Patescibacteria group bacterium]|nr:hypothetical protein [Patescibacteria group bacterium]
MKKIAIAVFLALLLGACSNQQLAQINTALDKYDQAVNNFIAAENRIDTSISLTSVAVAQWCDAAKSAGDNLKTVVKGNSTAYTSIVTLTGGINQYCTAPPQNVQSAVVQLTAMVAAAQQAYQNAKGGS